MFSLTVFSQSRQYVVFVARFCGNTRTRGKRHPELQHHIISLTKLWPFFVVRTIACQNDTHYNVDSFGSSVLRRPVMWTTRKVSLQDLLLPRKSSAHWM